MQNRSGNATRHWHGAAATTLTGSLRRFVTGDPATAALGGERSLADARANREVAPIPAVRGAAIELVNSTLPRPSGEKHSR